MMLPPSTTYTHLRHFLLSVITVALLVGVTPQLASANTTYTYAGNPFTSFTAPYSSSNSITGSMTYATPLPANLLTYIDGITPRPVAFSFTDGVHTYASANGINDLAGRDFQSRTFAVFTDGNGLIVGWSIFLSYSDVYLDSHNTDVGGVADVGFDHFPPQLPIKFGSNTNFPGAWSVTTTPEPSSLSLIVVGLMGLGYRLRKAKLRPQAGEQILQIRLRP